MAATAIRQDENLVLQNHFTHSMNENVIPHNYEVKREDRTALKGHKPFLLWFTGLSGSGKSTLANALEVALVKHGKHTYLLDGDNVRKGLNNNLGFSPEDRTENIRRIAEVANLMLDAGLIVLAAFVSPYRKDREEIRSIVGAENMLEVFVDTPLEECEKRDVKGLYKKARAGEIKNFTGIDAPYEAPLNPEIHVRTVEYSIEQGIAYILEDLGKRNLIS